MSLLVKLAWLPECQEARLWLRPLVPVALMTFVSQCGFEEGWEERGLKLSHLYSVSLGHVISLLLRQ